MRLARDFDYEYTVHKYFFGDTGWKESQDGAISTYDTKSNESSVINYPLFVGEIYDEECPRKSCPAQNQYEWMETGRGLNLDLSGPDRKPVMATTWDEYITRIRTELERTNQTNEEFLDGLQCEARLEWHYEDLIRLTKEIEILRYSRLADLVAQAPDSTFCDPSHWEVLLNNLRVKRMKVFVSCLNALFPQFDAGVVSLIAEFAGPRLLRLRIHYDEGSDV